MRAPLVEQPLLVDQAAPTMQPLLVDQAAPTMQPLLVEPSLLVDQATPTMQAPPAEPPLSFMQAPPTEPLSFTQAPLAPTPTASRTLLPISGAAVDPAQTLLSGSPPTFDDDAPTTPGRPFVLAVIALLLFGTGALGLLSIRGDDPQAPSGVCPPDPTTLDDPLTDSPAPTAASASGAAPGPATASTRTSSPASGPETAPAPKARSKRAHRRRRSSRHRARRKSKANDSNPAPGDDATTSESRSPSASELLRRAQSALSRGKAEDAYRLASRSHRAKHTPAAAILMARAACRTGDKDKAKRALEQLPLRDRGAVRRDCRQHGDRIGL